MPSDEEGRLSDFSDKTLGRDLRDLAQAFLDNAKTAKIVRKASVGTNLSTEEEQILIGFAESQPFMERFMDQCSADSFRMGFGTLNSTARHCNPFISIAVAQHVAAGDWPSVDDPRATELIHKNMVPGDVAESGNEGDDIVLGAWAPRKLTFDEYYDVLLEAWEDPKFQEALVEMLEAWIKVEGDYWDRQYWMPARDNLEGIAFKKMLKRGWISDPRFWDYTKIIVDHDIPIFDKDAVRDVISKFGGENVIQFENDQ
jgi:hypothetical protein